MSASANDQSLAILAQALYLANLMLLPGLAFLALLGLWLKHRHTASSLARCHLRQTVAASVWAGLLLVAVNLLIYFGGYHQPSTWVIVILYFITFHTSLILLGVVGLSKALAGQAYVFPLIGRSCHD